MTLPLQDALRGAGFIPVTNTVVLDNYRLDTWRRTSQGSLERFSGPRGSLLRESDDGSSRTGSLLYFWLAECDNCTEDVRTLDALAHEPRWPEGLDLRLILFDVDAPEQAARTLADLKLESPVYIDENGALAEKLAVLGSPAVFVLDGKGHVIGRMNGNVPFETPGFDSLLATLDALAKTSPPAPAWHALLNSEVAASQPRHVSFLGVPGFGSLWIVLLAVACCAIVKALAYRRKN